MNHNKRHRRVITLLSVLVCLSTLLAPVQATIPHRDPEDALTMEISSGSNPGPLPQKVESVPLQTGPITIHNNNFEGNKGYGLNSNIAINAENNWWGDANGPMHASNPQGRGDTVSDNVDFDPWLTSAVDIGIPYSPPPQPGIITLSQNSFEDNSTFGVQSSIPVNAENNWWGHPSGPYHPDTNPDGLGNAVSDFVDYEPWLAAPPGTRQATKLVLGQTLTDSVGPNAYRDYELVTTVGMSILVKAVPVNDSETLWVFSRLGDFPLWTRYDLRSQERAVRGAYELLLSPTQDGTYYISVYGRDVAATGGNYQIAANVVERYLSDVSLGSAGNAGEITFNLSGLGFVEGMGVELRSAGHPTLAADSIALESPTNLWAHFDLNGADIGVYDVYAVWTGGEEASLTEAFTITQGVGLRLEAHLITPEAVRPGRQYVLSVEYANTGDADLPAPLLNIWAENAELRLPEQEQFAGSNLQVLATSDTGPGGILPPGSRGRIKLIFRPSGSGATARFYVSQLQVSKSIVSNNGTLAAFDQVLAHDDQVFIKPNEGEEIKSSSTLAAVSNELVPIANAVFAAIERFYAPHIQAFLEEHGSGLATYQVKVLGEPKSAAEIVMNASIGYDYMVNPKILLAMLESINGLMTDSAPSPDQLEFAMGNPDPALMGFEKQVNWAASEIGRAYERNYYGLPRDQRYLAASLALQEFAKSLPDKELVQLGVNPSVVIRGNLTHKTSPGNHRRISASVY